MIEIRKRHRTRVVIAGTGGFGRETAEALRAAFRDPGPFSAAFAGFLDDDPATHRGRLPVVGTIEMIHAMPHARLVVCIGSPRNYFTRARIVGRLGLEDHRYATVLHPRAEVSTTSSVGCGSVLLAGAVLTADATVGRHVAVMPQAVVTHDCVVEDFATLASGVRLGGATRVGRGAYLGSGALVREGVHIGAWAMVGMGSVVLQDVGPGEVWVGNPARKLRTAEVPQHLLPTDSLRKAVAL
jgi:sugar O-acyltransferase (sialic acid O-acetyltransferase NeuD family)